jgi:4-amino-4-deoxy-L-arabinose transferase-like glycosyltransferase
MTAAPDAENPVLPANSETSPASPAKPWRRLFSVQTAVWAVFAFAAVVLFYPLARSGIWDPHELNVADLARRIAINRFGASGLDLVGSENGMPRLGDLGRGELPFTSIALGFRGFGLHEWSGRLPLAIWGLLGVVALYWMLSRLVDKRTGIYGVAILVTMPLYFTQARTMLGDIVTMAASSIAVAGLAVAAFDRSESTSRRIRAISIGVGIVGLVAGFMSRGLLIGVGMPASSVGLAWAITLSSSRRTPGRLADAAGAASLAVGAVAVAVGSILVVRAAANAYSPLVGFNVIAQSKAPTVDLVVHYLGHSLFPWSAFIPFAVGRLFRAPPQDAGSDGDSHVRLCLLVGSAIAVGVYTFVGYRAGYLAFGAPALLAAIAAICIRDFERSAPPSLAIGVGVSVMVVLFMRDYLMFPEKGLSAFAIAGGSFPESFKASAGNLIMVSSAIFASVFLFSWLEKTNRPWFDLKDYLSWPRALGRAWGGSLLVALAVVQAVLVVGAAAVAFGAYSSHASPHLKQILQQMGQQLRVYALNAFWVLPLTVLAVVWGTMLLRDAFRLFFDKTGVSRGVVTLAAGVVVGCLLSFVYYPALASQLSPKDVFESYARMRKDGEAMGLLGVGGRSTSYYSGGEVKSLTDVQSAYSWLTEAPGRRWLAVRNEDLGRLNSLHRARPGTKQNLPVLDARSSQILLVSNVLLPGENNQSPYESMVLDRDPGPANRVEANLQDQLLSIGWDVWDATGKTRVDSLVPAKKYHFRLYYKVLAQPSGEWETFIHIDGFHRRFNGDHKTLGGKYPFSLWQIGDYVVDDYEFSLEPNFTPGNYNLLYGLFVGETRMKVKSGKHDDNRIDAGMIRVQ